MGAGDAQLDASPPNVEEVQPPAESITTGNGAPDAGRQGEATDAPAGDLAQALDEETETLRREVEDLSDRHLRLAAEFDNYRRRVDRERQEVWSRAQADLAGRLLDVLDDLERVAHHSSGESPLLEGVQLVEKKLRTVLDAAGLEQIEAENAGFDPNSMEAVAMVPTENPDEDDVVSDVFQRGYRFKGQLLRPARVRVKKHH